MSPPPRLLTIPISHYCEKARWALERAGFEYEEEAHLQLIHRLHAVWVGGGRRVPVLVTDAGPIGESSRIIRWVDRRLDEDMRLVPGAHEEEVSAIEARLDEGLGVEGRRWMYSALIGSDVPRRFGLDPLPAWERRSLPLMVPVMRLYLRTFMDAEPRQAASALAAVEEELDWIEGLLADGRRYLVGDRFTAADLGFAALSAPFLLPDRYGVELPGPGDLPPEAAREVERLRARPAGRFAARLVAEERPWPPPAAGRRT